MCDKDYWEEVISQAADECDLSLTKEQLSILASAASSGHEHYGLAFYDPGWGDRLDEVERSWKKKYEALELEYREYQERAEKAYIRGAKLPSYARVTIGEYGVERYE